MDLPIYILISYFILGSCAGFLSGLFGIGGGLVVVPGLTILFAWQHFPPEIIMHLAAGTSLAVMIFTAARSLLAHLKRGAVIWPIYKKLLPGVILGAVGGALLAYRLHSRILMIVFAVFVLLMALRMFFIKSLSFDQHRLPGPLGMTFAGLTIGGKSGLLGLGGGAITIPFLTYCEVSMRQAVAVSVAISLTIGVIGTLMFIITGSFSALAPSKTFGYIYWPAVLVVMMGSLLFSPIGVRLSHSLPTAILKQFFAIFLFVVGIRMLIV
jgi:uncharacterized protein